MKCHFCGSQEIKHDRDFTIWACGSILGKTGFTISRVCERNTVPKNDNRPVEQFDGVSGLKELANILEAGDVPSRVWPQVLRKVSLELSRFKNFLWYLRQADRKAFRDVMDEFDREVW